MKKTQLVTNPDGSQLASDIYQWLRRNLDRRMHLIVRFDVDNGSVRVFVSTTNRTTKYSTMTLRIELEESQDGFVLFGCETSPQNYDILGTDEFNYLPAIECIVSPVNKFVSASYGREYSPTYWRGVLDAIASDAATSYECLESTGYAKVVYTTGTQPC